MKNIKIGLLIAFCIIQNSYSQTSKESEILISEENLISLINTIKQKRDSLYNINLRNNQMVQNSKGTKSQVVNSKYTEYDLVLSRMDFLENKLDYLTSIIQKQNTSNPNTVSKSVPTASITTASPNNNDTYLRSRIKDLENELNDVKSAQSNEKNLAQASNKTTASETTLKNTPILPTSITNNYITEATQKSIRDTIVIENKERSDYDVLVKKYSESSQNVLFDNNSAEVKTTYFETLDQLVVLCNANAKIDLFLKGFASKKGNVAYNQKLSMQRTESVKKYFIEKGIHPSRILSQFYGVDYASKNEENARRVTITYVIRR